MQSRPKKKDEQIAPDKSSWSDDQRERGYYYDDACGYETYVPGGDDDEDKKSRASQDGPAK